MSDIKEKIDAYLEENRLEMAKNTSEMIQINTVNAGPGTCDERPLLDYIEPLMKEIGMETKRVAFDPEKKRENLIGVLKGTGKGRDIILNSHADTVPEGNLDKWTYPPFSGIIADDKVHGRGAVDDKGCMTSILWGIKAIKENNVPINGDIYFICSAGEEAAEGKDLGLGPAIVVNEYKDPFCMVIEPSAMELCPTASGLFDFKLTVYGKPAHTCARGQMLYPQNINLPCGYEVGADALQKALPYIDYFYRFEREIALRYRDDLLAGGGKDVPNQVGVGIFTCGPINIHGGGDGLSVMDQVTITYSCWYPEYAGLEKLIQEIKNGVEAITQTDEWTRNNPPLLEIPYLFSWRGAYLDPDHEAVQMWFRVLSDVTNGKGNLAGCPGCTDATFALERGIPTAVCGPGNLGGNHLHGPNEYIDISDLVTTSRMCAHMIAEYCK